jgi:hypothetical protein
MRSKQSVSMVDGRISELSHEECAKLISFRASFHIDSAAERSS